MTYRHSLITATLLALTPVLIYHSYYDDETPDKPAYEVAKSPTSPEPTAFWASTPCDAYPRTLLSIPATTDCELIKWNLALHYHPRTGVPTRFTLRYTYGISKPSTENLMNGGNTGVMEGTWTRVTSTPNKVVYRLTPTEASNHPLDLLRLQDNLLHLLDQEGKLMIGHAGWSYTLNGK